MKNNSKHKNDEEFICWIYKEYVKQPKKIKWTKFWIDIILINKKLDYIWRERKKEREYVYSKISNQANT